MWIVVLWSLNRGCWRLVRWINETELYDSSFYSCRCCVRNGLFEVESGDDCDAVESVRKSTKKKKRQQG